MTTYENDPTGVLAIVENFEKYGRVDVLPLVHRHSASILGPGDHSKFLEATEDLIKDMSPKRE